MNLIKKLTVLITVLVLAALALLPAACSKTAVPAVASINPNKAYLGATVSMVITGANFDSASEVAVGNGVSVSSFTVDSATQITASITVSELAELGTRDVMVTTPQGSDTLDSGFTVQEDTSFTLVDDTDTSFSFDAPVESIVTLSPSATEIVFAVGAGDKLIGRTDYCNYPAAAADVDSIGSFWAPDKENIVIKNPDVILAGNRHVANGDAEWLTEQGLTVIVLDPADFDGITDNIMLVGIITGKQAEAAEVIATMQEQTAYVTDRVASLEQSQKTRVLHVTWDNPLWTVGANNFAHEVIETAGGKNIFDDLEGDVQASIETAIARDPQVIVAITGHGTGYYTPYNNISAPDSLYKDTYAHMNNRIHMLNADIIARPSPRITEALLIYARLLHPEIFA